MNKDPNATGTNDVARSLPRPWDVAVQLIGTFGLAVFLVLYYIFIMRPEEIEAYNKLRDSIESLSSVLQNQQSQITRDQESGIENLYVHAVALDTATRIVEGLRKGQSQEEIGIDVENVLINRARLVQGFIRRDGRILSERFTNRIRESRIADTLAREAVHEWKTKDHAEISKSCFSIIERELFRK